MTSRSTNQIGCLNLADFHNARPFHISDQIIISEARSINVNMEIPKLFNNAAISGETNCSAAIILLRKTYL